MTAFLDFWHDGFAAIGRFELALGQLSGIALGFGMACDAALGIAWQLIGGLRRGPSAVCVWIVVPGGLTAMSHGVRVCVCVCTCVCVGV